MQVAVLDGSNRQVPTGKIGEVCIQGPNVTKGYLNRPEANKEAYAGVQTGSTVTSVGSKYCHIATHGLDLSLPGNFVTSSVNTLSSSECQTKPNGVMIAQAAGSTRGTRASWTGTASSR